MKLDYIGFFDYHKNVCTKHVGTFAKAELLQLKLTPITCLINLINEKSRKSKKPTQYSTFKTDIIKVGLVFSISNFFIAKTSLANNWRSFSSSYSALIVRTEKQIHASKELKPMFEPSFLAKVGQHSIMPSFEELIRVVYWGQFLVLTPTCCSHLLNPRFL